MPKLGAWSSTSPFRFAIVYSATAAPFVLVECYTQHGGARGGRRIEPLEQVQPGGIACGGRAQALGRLRLVAGGGAGEGRPEEELVAVGREGERLVDHPRGTVAVALLGVEHQRVGPVERVKASQLREGIGVVVDAQV